MSKDIERLRQKNKNRAQELETRFACLHARDLDALDTLDAHLILLTNLNFAQLGRAWTP